jgi:hypothetical protein
MHGVAGVLHPEQPRSCPKILQEKVPVSGRNATGLKACDRR